MTSSPHAVKINGVVVSWIDESVAKVVDWLVEMVDCWVIEDGTLGWLVEMVDCWVIEDGALGWLVGLVVC